jgi:alpha-glucosidase (family GH31 glycosyl hydrolase)
MPRRYTLGTWYSRWWPYTSSDYRQIVQQFHDHNFPLDMIVMDMDWHQPPNYTGLSWNRALLPDAEQLLKDFHTDGLHITLNDHPQGGVQPSETTYGQFMTAMGQNPASGATLSYDAGNQKYIETLLSITHTNLELEGVDFWWLDWMGDDQGPFNRMGWMNELYFRHTETSIPSLNLRGQSFSRWADFGDQRHAIHFSGDTKIDWPTLQFEIPFTATAGNVGCFYWSNDIGGFIDDNNPINGILKIRQGELIARWTQFGAVSPILRLHSANKEWLDKRPWTYPSDIEESMRRSFQFRSQIFPYIYSSAWESHENSVPIVRPLYLEFPELADSYTNSQEYFFGDAMLAAPIVTPGDGYHGYNSSQKVWFPPGRWFDWFTDQEYSGQTQSTVWKQLYEFPLFARGGYPILMQPYTERMSGQNTDHLIIRLFPGVDGETHSMTFYEDDGETRGYLSGDYALTEVAVTQVQGLITVSIKPTSRSHNTSKYVPATRSYEIQYVSGSPLKGATFDNSGSNAGSGTGVPVTYISAQKMNQVLVPAASSADGVAVSLSY